LDITTQHMNISARSAVKLLGLGICVLLFVSATPLVRGQASDFDREIDQLNQKILDQKKQIDNLRLRQQEYKEKIKAKQEERVSLNNQLAILEDRLAEAQADIEGTNLEIDKTNLEIKKIELDKESLDKKIEANKQHIASLIRSMHKQDQASTLELLLLNDSLAEFLNQARYLQDANTEIGRSVNELKADKDNLEGSIQALNTKNKELLSLKADLENKKDSLDYEQTNKSNLLAETKASEREFQSLIEAGQREQRAAEAAISSAETLIRKKMSERDRQKLNDGNNTIAWPVPQNTITAGFRDSTYPYRGLIGEHSAVDIRAKQGTTIKAAADGYVAKVKFDGTKNYAYIMLIHGDGLSTVYGHVSAVYVMADQYVKQGQAIGKTGGMPGGTGSGPFTTGPHLHFEVRLNGLPVNPAKYLP
jgi:murein DD-endopeptidase MepM/ murein hydrolase activator NlpD